MKKMKVYAISTAVLCVVASLALLLSMLALNDIYHAEEPNLRGEWLAVRWTFGVFAVLILSAGLLASAYLRGPDRPKKSRSKRPSAI
jgi:uncharacterized BrkB/YihY/UPF0761 family membrane protein